MSAIGKDEFMRPPFSLLFGFSRFPARPERASLVIANLGTRSHARSSLENHPNLCTSLANRISIRFDKCELGCESRRMFYWEFRRRLFRLRFALAFFWMFSHIRLSLD
jgi:hypothetical protein